MKKTVFIITIALIIVLCGVGYSYFMIEDTNGLTKYDVRQAEKALHSYINSQNIQEYDESVALLSEFYADRMDAMRKMFEYDSGMIYDDFQSDYTEDVCRRILYPKKRHYADIMTDKKAICFICSFTAIARQEGCSLGGFEENMEYRGYELCLVKEKGEWKVLSWGY